MQKYFKILKINILLILLFGCQVGDEWMANPDGEVVYRRGFSSVVQGKGINEDLNKVGSLYQTNIRNSDNREFEGLATFTAMPSWAEAAGLKEPSGMIPDVLNSYYTSVSNPSEGFNSITRVYQADYETARHEAVRIATLANIPVLPERETAKASRASVRSGKLRFTNYNLTNHPDDYYISVEVDTDGSLTIMATDIKQLNARLAGQMPDNKRLFASGISKK